MKSERAQEEIVDLSYDRQAVISAVATDSGARLVTELASITADIISIFRQRSLHFADEQARTVALVRRLAGIIGMAIGSSRAGLGRLDKT